MHDNCVLVTIIFIACQSHKTNSTTTTATAQQQLLMIFFTGYCPSPSSSAAGLVFHQIEPTPTFGLCHYRLIANSEFFSPTFESFFPGLLPLKIRHNIPFQVF